MVSMYLNQISFCLQNHKFHKISIFFNLFSWVILFTIDNLTKKLLQKLSPIIKMRFQWEDLANLICTWKGEWLLWGYRDQPPGGTGVGRFFFKKMAARRHRWHKFWFFKLFELAVIDWRPVPGAGGGRGYTLLKRRGLVHLRGKVKDLGQMFAEVFSHAKSPHFVLAKHLGHPLVGDKILLIFRIL